MDTFDAIERWKAERNAVILAHYYQDPDVQDVADYVGDSLGLAREAANIAEYQRDLGDYQAQTETLGGAIVKAVRTQLAGAGFDR